MSVFDTSQNKSTLFFGGGVGIARYDKVKYPFLDKLTDQQLKFFWLPQRIDVVRDQSDFKSLTDSEKHIFTSNLKRQIVLDSVQGRAPVMVLLPIASQPELENWIIKWSESETIHSRSYSHIIQNIYAKPSQVFDEILDIPEIMDCIEDISKYYDDLHDLNIEREAKLPGYSEYNHKKALWLCLHAINALEGIRFYASFACSWAFAEVKKMEGNAKIIKEICRDENLHLGGTQQLLKVLPKDDPDFIRIKEETQDEVLEIWSSVIEQEKDWARFLFKDGSMLGLNEIILCEYVDWIASKRMTTIGLKPYVKPGPNPLSWTEKWISGKETQVAPQEVQVDSYLEGGIKSDIQENAFKNFEL